MQIHNLGFPRIGAKRELKFSLEKYWRGELSQTDFLTECQDRRLKNWQIQQEAGVELLPVGDFAHYDHVLNTTLLLGLAPERFTTQQHNHSDATAHNLDNSVEQNTLDLEFRIGRGQAPSGCECAASDMTKWFNTNYHYIVPELSAVLLAKGTTVNTDNLLAHFTEAQVITDNRKAVLLGPITYLHLSVTGKEDKLALLPELLIRYQAVLTQLSDAGVQWLQLDEPVLGIELDNKWQQAFSQAYQQLNKGQLKVLLTSYFASIDHHIDLIKDLDFDGLHIDTIAEQSDVTSIIERLPNDWIISLGVINGRNVWKTDLVSVYQTLQPLYQTLGERLWLAPSCSLLHSPVDLNQESKLDAEFISWLAFAKQKCQELSLLKNALVNENCDEITLYSNPAVARSVSKRINNVEVQQRVGALTATDFARKETFEARKAAQQAELNLPLLPTTTIGSFPQTGDIRDTRAKWRRSEISDEQYTRLIQDEIRNTITRQEEIGLYPSHLKMRVSGRLSDS